MTWNILYCSDNNYAPYLGVSMLSLLESNKDAKDIAIYVVSDNISEENTERLKKQLALYGDNRRLIIIDGQKWIERLKGLHLLPYRGGLTTDLRLFFMEYIEEDVERLLYLDCDTIVCGCLSELFNMPMEGKPAAAVLDSLSGKEYKKIIGFTPEDSYFNAGMMLFDIAKWRELDCQGQLAALMSNPEYLMPNNDQDFLNILLREQKLIIHPKYNLQTTHKVYTDAQYHAAYSREGYYTAAEIGEARETPVIIHAYRFLGQFPWHKNASHPFREMFWALALKSEWSDISPKENKGLMFAIERIAFKIMPKKVFVVIFKKYQTYAFTKRLKMMKKKHKEEQI